MTERSDLELIEAFRQGEESAFNEIVLRYQEKIYWVARRFLPSHADADDIVQEVFIRAYERLQEFRSESGLFTWLYRIAVNTSLNALRRRKVREFFQIDTLLEHEDTRGIRPDQAVEHDEQKKLIDEAIQRLPEKQKAVFIMRYVDDLSYEEIAEILKTSVGGLKANYFHALRKIEDYVRRAHQS
jgi:RNA polymerase sigma-70 factor (ECF subfamily)